MRRLVVLALAVSVLMVIPTATAASDPCPTLEGRAVLDYGNKETGKAILLYDGSRMVVDFDHLDFISEENRVEFAFHFPQGTVEVHEFAEVMPLSGPTVAFDSDLDVVDGGSGQWQWSGISNIAGGKAIISSISGALCIDAP